MKLNMIYDAQIGCIFIKQLTCSNNSHGYIHIIPLNMIKGKIKVSEKEFLLYAVFL